MQIITYQVIQAKLNMEWVNNCGEVDKIEQF